MRNSILDDRDKVGEILDWRFKTEEEGVLFMIHIFRCFERELRGGDWTEFEQT